MSISLKPVREFISTISPGPPGLRFPGQLVIQITDACNATCGQCGMRVTNRFPRTRLSLDNIKAIIDRAGENKVKAISFTGGEPFLFCDDLIEMIRYAHRAGIPFIRTGTNGFFLRYNGDRDQFKRKIYPLAQKLADSGVRNFWISIDSANGDRHEKMRGLRGVIKGIEMALPVFAEAGLYPSANLGINRYMGGGKGKLKLPSSRWTHGGDATSPGMDTGFSTVGEKASFYREACDAFSQFYSFVIALGFTIVNACYPMSMDDEKSVVYPASSKEDLIRFSGEEKVLLFKALKDTIPEYRNQIRIFSPLTSLHALGKQHTGKDCFYPCLGGISFFYIDSRDGEAYPCGYRGGENLGRYQDLDLSSMDKKPFCTRCDWECFRDPSALFGPLMETMRNPVGFFRRSIKDPKMLKYLYSDLRYYRKCSYFNGKKPFSHS